MYRRVLWVTLILFYYSESYRVSVDLKQGRVIGTTEVTAFDRKQYYAFYGVPYARPPVRRLRFKNPKPQKTWDKPVDATTRYHGACAQAHIVHKHGLYGVEDCLHVNIYAPAPRGPRRPAVVWVHGHAFTNSFSHIHGGDFFIENDIIFISLTYRLSVFGFLKLNETDDNANMGLRDIVAGLKWIRRNIEKFGGDKNKITVMGSDSGATFLSLLLLTESKKLFSKIILQSGGPFSPSIFQSDPLIEKDKLSQELKNMFTTNITKASTKKIIAASLKVLKYKDWINHQKPLIPFSPIVETYSEKPLITLNPYTDLKDINVKIPILLGFNTQESISEMIPFLRNPNYLKSFSNIFKFMVPFVSSCSHKYVSSQYTKIANVIKKKYFKGDVTEDSLLSFVRYVSDLHKYPVYKFIKALLNGGTKNMYVYKFNYVGRFNAIKASSIPGATVNVKGAAKGDEICYLMRCEPLWETYYNINNNATDRDRIFMKDMVGMWSNFITSGNPTPRKYFGNITWLPMTSNNDNILLLSKNSRIIDSKSEENMFTFWNKIYNDYYSPEHCGANKHEEL